MMRKGFDLLRRHFRQGRYLQIRNLMKVESRTGVILDLGGGPASFFAARFPRPEQVILLEINQALACQAKQKQPALHVIVADGERLPLADCSIEIIVCNSVIEHVDHPDALAAEMRRVGQGYFLQTPCRDFPLETHSFIAMPFYSLIPWMWLRRLVCKVFKANFEYLSSVRYLSEQGLRLLFPEAVITHERVLGLKKSFYVYCLNRNV